MNRTGEPAYEPRAGALAGRGWYEWASPYAQMVIRRDAQLGELLDWLAKRDAPGSVRATETRSNVSPPAASVKAWA
jgi:hypothetical protein